MESAPYETIQADENNGIEIRRYVSMILVSTPMNNANESQAFSKLFNYINGSNKGSQDIAMTAPVFMDNTQQNGEVIAMTAPVLMAKKSEGPSMSFVMPEHFTLDTTPKPNDPSITISKITNYKVAAIKFSGTLGDSNINKHITVLREWMRKHNVEAIGNPVTAGYDSPFTLPFLRHNEVLIPIQ